MILSTRFMYIYSFPYADRQPFSYCKNNRYWSQSAHCSCFSWGKGKDILWALYREFFMLGANIPKHLLLLSSVLDTLQNYFTPTLLVLKITKQVLAGNPQRKIRRIVGLVTALPLVCRERSQQGPCWRTMKGTQGLGSSQIQSAKDTKWLMDLMYESRFLGASDRKQNSS